MLADLLNAVQLTHIEAPIKYCARSMIIWTFSSLDFLYIFLRRARLETGHYFLSAWSSDFFCACVCIWDLNNFHPLISRETDGMCTNKNRLELGKISKIT